MMPLVDIDPGPPYSVLYMSPLGRFVLATNGKWDLGVDQSGLILVDSWWFLFSRRHAY